VTGIGLLGGMAYAFYDSVTAAADSARYDAEEVGLQAAGASALIAAIASFLLGRVVRELVLASAEPAAADRLSRRTIVGAALGFGALVSVVTVGYFSWSYERFNATAYEWNQQHVGRGEVVAAAVLGATLFYSTVLSYARIVRPSRLVLAAGSAVVVLAISLFGVSLVIEEMSIIPLALGSVGAAIAFILVRPSTDERMQKVDVAEVRDEVRAMRRAVRRNQLSLLGGLLAGAAVAAFGWWLLDIAYEHLNRGASYYDRSDPGLGHVIALLVAASLAGLMATRLLQRGVTTPDEEPLGDTGGIFDETLATTGSLEVRQQITLASLLFGSASRAGYQLTDGGGAFCGTARERGSVLGRLLIGGRRPIHVEVDDLGRTALTIRRRFWPSLLFNHAQVMEGERDVGRVRQRWSLRRRYRLQSSSGEEHYELVSGWILRGRFRIVRRGESVGELRRLRRPWYVRMFTHAWQEPDRFALRFPADASVDERRLMTGALFLVDITHYPTQAWLRIGPLLVAAAIALTALVSSKAPDTHPDESFSESSLYDEP